MELNIITCDYCWKTITPHERTIIGVLSPNGREFKNFDLCPVCIRTPSALILAVKEGANISGIK